jgi:hypothetical protein
MTDQTTSAPPKPQRSALAHLGAVLVDAQPAFQLLGATPLLGRRVPFALPLAP